MLCNDKLYINFKYIAFVGIKIMLGTQVERVETREGGEPSISSSSRKVLYYERTYY